MSYCIKVFEVGTVSYSTKAIILWSGELVLGHYTIAVKMGDIWLLYNDDKIHEIGDDAYFMFCLKSNCLGLPYTIVGEHV